MDPRIEQTILVMATRFRDPLTLAELAAGVGLSPFHFHRIFKAQTRENQQVLTAPVDGEIGSRSRPKPFLATNLRLKTL